MAGNRLSSPHRNIHTNVLKLTAEFVLLWQMGEVPVFMFWWLGKYQELEFSLSHVLYKSTAKISLPQPILL